MLNGSTFNYTIVDAFDGVDSTPVSSFSYYNNPFSDGCDVVRIPTVWTALYNSSRRNI